MTWFYFAWSQRSRMLLIVLDLSIKHFLKNESERGIID